MNRFIIASAVFMILFLIAENILIKHISNRLSMYCFHRKFEEYNQLRNQWYTLYLFKAFNLKFMDLNAAILQGNQDEIKKRINELEKIRMNRKQKNLVYSRVFYYYILTQEKEQAQKYYYLLCNGQEENMPKDILIFYNTFIEEESKYLEEVLDLLKTCDMDQRADLESLLSKIYENKGELELADQYRIEAEKHFFNMKKKKIMC